MLILGEYIIINNLDNKINNKSQEIIKNTFFLFVYFINDTPNRLMILIIYIIYEYFFECFYNNHINKINQLIISIAIININEIFYLLVNRVYALETSKLIFSRTITYHLDEDGIFNTFLKLSYKIRISIILIGFFLETNFFGNKLLDNRNIFIIKTILNIKCCFNFIFFCYEFIFLKNNEDFITIFVYSLVDLVLFLLDFINNFLIYINLLIIKFIKKRAKSSRHSFIS